MGKYETVKLIDPLSLLNLWEGCTFMKTRFACVTLCLQPARTICYHDYIYITIPHEPFAAIRSILDLFRSRFFLTEPNLAAKRKSTSPSRLSQGSLFSLLSCLYTSDHLLGFVGLLPTPTLKRQTRYSRRLILLPWVSLCSMRSRVNRNGECGVST
jgi:hypothetical protein